MRPFLAVLRKEVLERRLIFVAAFCLGLIPLATLRLVDWRGVDSAELRDSIALLVAGLFVVAAAAALGTSMISRELAGGRLAFYYVRPLGAWSLWWGKLGAVVVLLAASFALVWLPSVLAGSRPWSTELRLLELPWGMPHGFNTSHDPWQFDVLVWYHMMGFGRASADTVSIAPFWLALAIGGLMLVVLLAHAVAVVARARSAWTLLDLAMTITVLGLLAASAARLNARGAIVGLGRSTIVFFAALVVAAALAPWVQLGWGRSLVKRSHGVYSRTLWGVLLAVSVALLGFAHLATRATPDELAQFSDLEAPPRGDWLVIGGLARGGAGFLPTFAVDLRDGRSREMAPLVFLDGPPVFSANGRVLAWSRCDAVEPRCEFHLLELDDPRLEIHSTGITRPRPPRGNRFLDTYDGLGQVALAPAGDRLAIADRTTVSVYDPMSARLLVALRLPSNAWDVRLRFASRDLLRAYLRGSHGRLSTLNVWELDLPGQQWTRTAELSGGNFALSRDGTRMVVWGELDGSVVVHDADGSRKLFDLTDFGELGSPYDLQMRFLSSGELVGATKTGGHLRVFTSDGEEEHRIALPGRVLVLGGEPAPGQLLVGVSRFDPSEDAKRRRPGRDVVYDVGAFETLLIDAAAGEIRRTWSGILPGRQRSVPGSPASRLVVTERRMLGLVDLDTGEIEPILRH